MNAGDRAARLELELIEVVLDRVQQSHRPVQVIAGEFQVELVATCALILDPHPLQLLIERQLLALHGGQLRLGFPQGPLGVLVHGAAPELLLQPRPQPHPKLVALVFVEVDVVLMTHPCRVAGKAGPPCGLDGVIPGMRSSCR